MCRFTATCLDLEKLGFLDKLVIFYENHLSGARKLDVCDVWPRRPNVLFLPHSVKVRRDAMVEFTFTSQAVCLRVGRCVHTAECM